MQKKIQSCLAVVALLLGLGLAAAPARATGIQQPPSWGQNANTKLSSVADRAVPLDKNGAQWSEVRPGYNVFESSGSASAAQVKDPLGNTPACGYLHSMCLDQSLTSAYAIAVDTPATGGVTVNGGGSLTGRLTASTTAQICQTYDAKFETGLAVVGSDVSAGIHVYWAPCAARGQ